MFTIRGQLVSFFTRDDLHRPWRPLPSCYLRERHEKNLLLAAGVSVLSLSAQAEQFWADNSFSLLYGDNYKMVPAGESTKATVMTLEHVSGHSWGGMFFFIDRVNSGEGAYDETYGELSPSISLAKFDGFVKGINAAFTYEVQQPAMPKVRALSVRITYLAGVGRGSGHSGADYFSATVYRSKNNNQVLIPFTTTS